MSKHTEDARHHLEIGPTPTAAYDSKGDVQHVEDLDLKERDVKEIVVDTDAAEYVNHELQIDEAENKRLRRIINRRLLPLMCLVYMTQALDKGALGPVSIMGWLDDVNAKGQDYALTSTVMWIGFIIGEPLAAQFIRRFPVAKILAVSMLIWTALSMGLAFSLSIPAVLANRFLIGFFESTFNPCLVTITVQWYRKSEQPFVSAIWQSMVALATTIMSILAWGFYQVEYDGSGLRGWQYLIIVVSLFSAVGAAITLIYLPDAPTKARWADDDLKSRFVERVRSNNQGLKNKKWNSEQAWEAAKDPFAYCLFAFALCQTLIVGGIGKFNSLLINQAFGFDVLTSQLLKIPMSLCGVAFYYLMAFFIWKYNNTLFAMCGFAGLNMVGTIVLITVEPSSKTRVGLFIAFILMQSFSACNTAMFLMLSRNIAGQTKKSLVYATTFMAWAGGNAIAPQFFWADWAPRYINSLYIHMGLYVVFISACLGARVLLVRRNKAKIAAQQDTDVNATFSNLHAFEDLTDLKNPDFRYCL